MFKAVAERRNLVKLVFVTRVTKKNLHKLSFVLKLVTAHTDRHKEAAIR